MRKFGLRSEQVSSSSAYVDDASDIARALTWAEAKSPGDYGNAMQRVARAAKVPAGLLWRLHYRKPKVIDTADFVNLGKAYDQRGLFRQERGRIAPRTALGRFLVGAADALDRAADALDG